MTIVSKPANQAYRDHFDETFPDAKRLDPGMEATRTVIASMPEGDAPPCAKCRWYRAIRCPTQWCACSTPRCEIHPDHSRPLLAKPPEPCKEWES